MCSILSVQRKQFLKGGNRDMAGKGFLWGLQQHLEIGITVCSKSFKQRIDGWGGWSEESWRIQGKTNRKSDASYTRTWCKRDRRLHPRPRLKEIKELEELESQMDSGKDAEWKVGRVTAGVIQVITWWESKRLLDCEVSSGAVRRKVSTEKTSDCTAGNPTGDVRGIWRA